MTDLRTIDEAAAAEAAVGPDARGRRFWRDALRRRMLAAADVLAIVAATGAALAWTRGDSSVFGVLAFTPGWLVIAKLAGLYDLDHRRLRHLTTDELARIVVYVLAGSVAMTAVSSPPPTVYGCC